MRLGGLKVGGESTGGATVTGAHGVIGRFRW